MGSFLPESPDGLSREAGGLLRQSSSGVTRRPDLWCNRAMCPPHFSSNAALAVFLFCVISIAMVPLGSAGSPAAASGASAIPAAASTAAVASPAEAVSAGDSAWTPLLLPPGLGGSSRATTADPEEMEGRLDASMARTIDDPGEVFSWTETAVLQLRLGRFRGALRTVERARRQSKWNAAEAGQLDFLEVAAQIALEPSEWDPLKGEDRLRRVDEALWSMRDLPGMKLSSLYGHAWVECEWGRPDAAAALLDSLPSLPSCDRLRLWKAMVRASSSGMDTWRPHFEKARAEKNLQKMREAARLDPGSYLLTLQQGMDEPIEEGLERTGKGSAVDFSGVESLMAAIPWDPPDFYRGIRRRMAAVRALDAATSRQALQLMRDQHRFDSFFSKEQWDWKERCRRAVEFSEGKAAACEKIGLWYLAGRWHWGRAFAQGELGWVHENISECEKAVHCASILGDPAYLTTCSYNLFMGYGLVGDRARRLHILPELVEISERYQVSTIEVHAAQARAFEDLGDLDRAWEAGAAAYRESRRRGHRYLEISGLSDLVWTAMRRGENAVVENYARTELQRAQEPSLSQLPASYRESVAAQLSMAMLALGKSFPSGDPRRMQWYAKALASARGGGQYQARLYVLLARAEEELALAEVKTAQSTLDDAQALCNAQGLEYGLWRVYTMQARCFAVLSSWKEAAGRYKDALARLENLGSKLNDAQQRAEFLLPASKLFEETISILAGPLCKPTEAYAVDERDRARALLHQLGRGASFVDGEKEEGGAPVSIASQVQSTLAEDELLLQYRVNPDHIDLWVLTATTLRTVALPLHADRLREKADAWREAIDNGLPSRLSEELASFLFAPVRGELDAAQGVVIVADAPLSALPFSLLRLDGRLLLEDHVVSREISGSIRVLLASRPMLSSTPKLLAVGYDGSVAPARLRIRLLPQAEQEAAEVAQLVPGGIVLRGSQATATAVASHLKGVGILHIASHSGLDEFGEPFLLLAPERSKPALIRGEDLAQWPLTGVSLVTLAGCESSLLGSSKTEGDLSSLGAAIFSGGSRDLIASLWKVEDRSTLELMRYFYADFLQTRVSAAQSLRRAQLRMAHEGHNLQREWGAFVSYGP